MGHPSGVGHPSHGPQVPTGGLGWSQAVALVPQETLETDLRFGDANQNYEFDAIIYQNGALVDLFIRPNGSNSDQETACFERINAVGNQFFDFGELVIVGGLPDGSRIRVHGFISQLDGVSVISYDVSTDDGGGVWQHLSKFVGAYYLPLTSCLLQASTATGIGVNSRFRMRKL